MSNDTKKPIRVLKSWPIEAAIWRNDRPDNDGYWYEVNISRVYKKGDEYHRASSFSNAQLLIVSHLAAKAYDAVAQLEAKDRVDAETGREAA